MVVYLLTVLVAAGQGADLISRKKLTPDATTRGWLDTAPKGYRDYMPGYRTVADGKNAVIPISKAVRNLEHWDSMNERWKKSKKDGVWQNDYWEKTLATNKEVYELIKKASKMPYLQIKKPVRVDSVTVGLMHMMKCTRLLEFHLIYSLNTNNLETAAEQMATAERLARLAMEADGGLVGWLVAIASYQRVFDMMDRMLDHPLCKDKQIVLLRKQLDAVPLGADRFKDAFRFEFLVFSNLVNDMYLGKFSPDEVMGVGDGGKKSAVRQILTLAMVRAFLQPNRSIRQYARVVKHAHRMASLPAWKRKNLKKSEFLQWLEDKPVSRDFVSFNAIGNVLIKLAAPLVLEQASKLDQHVSKLNMLRLKVALKRYHLKHGALPDALDKLTPQWIKALPADPYDGKKIRYSAKKRLLWCVGEDGKNAGGLTKEKSRWSYRDRKNEPTIRLEFAR